MPFKTPATTIKPALIHHLCLKSTGPTIGNMSGTYTNRTDPNILPVQHAQCKVPIEYWEQIEKMLDDMAAKGVIAPFSQPT